MLWFNGFTNHYIKNTLTTRSVVITSDATGQTEDTFKLLQLQNSSENNENQIRTGADVAW